MLPARAAALALLVSTTAFAAFHRSDGSARRAPAISLRKRLHVSPLITEPDTIDFEWGASFDTNGAITLPAVVHYTPRGPYVFWGRTEFAVSFDSLNYDGAVRHFGDRASVQATCVLHDGAKLDLAVAPVASFLFRGDTGARYGAVAIARYDSGRHSGGVTVAWTGATTPSPTNPAGTFDIGLGYGYAIGKFTPHVNGVWERSTGTARQISLFEGIEYQLTDPFAIDFVVQHNGLWGGAHDTQFVIGVTVNSGHLHRH
jgi:hypothetical protein